MNVIIRRLTECKFRQETRKDGRNKTNGFYLVGIKNTRGSWGTCFLRIISEKSKKSQFEIELTYEDEPSTFHTYTKIPHSIAHNVFHVYCNYPENKEYPALAAHSGMRVIGFDTPQRSGKYLNRSFLIYCPSGEPPLISATISDDNGDLENEEFIIETHEDNELLFDREKMFRGRKYQKIFINEEGYPKKFFDKEHSPKPIGQKPRGRFLTDEEAPEAVGYYSE